MEPEDEILFKNVWMEKNQDLLDEIVDVWIKCNALPTDEKPMDRAKQVVFIARTRSGEIAGISTARPSFIKQLKANLYMYRCFTAPEYRRKKIMRRITVLTRDYLETLYENNQSKCVGIIAEIQNKGLEKTMTHAVYPASGLSLIGYSKAGNQVRVYYFKGAKI